MSTVFLVTFNFLGTFNFFRTFNFLTLEIICEKKLHIYNFPEKIANEVNFTRYKAEFLRKTFSYYSQNMSVFQFIIHIS